MTMNESQIRLLYLATHKFEDGKVIRGAFLLTDNDTKPVEFRCTNPVRPTQLQTILYGEILQEHIMVELIGLPLVQSVRETADVILVIEPDFLNMRTKVDIPVVLLTKEERIATVDGHEDNFQMLTSTSGFFEPVVLSTHGDFPTDKTQSRAILGDIFNTHDLIEPFNRISKALEQVHAQKLGES